MPVTIKKDGTIIVEPELPPLSIEIEIDIQALIRKKYK